MADSVSPADLRPADLLILYYCYSNGQGATENIATTISRNRAYVSDRISQLADWDLVERVGNETGPITLTVPDGLELIASVEETYILPDQRREIDAATPYSVTWRGLDS